MTIISKLGLDWSQFYWAGPRRTFSDAELARGGQQPWPRGVDSYVVISLVLVCSSMYSAWPQPLRPWLWLGVAAFVALGLAVARRLWQRPTRTRLNLFGYALMLPVIVLTAVLGLVLRLPKDLLLLPISLATAFTVLSYLGWWTVVVLRVQQIEGRLAELDEQDRAVRLARQLATAQIQPHFLFNTLASLQHWVDTQDPRAAPTLRAFTQYLRSTLPMFERETLSLAEELQIVRHYLTVMQARLGERLAWAIDADPALDGLTLPPGTLLTLVENAIAHGIEPSLRGGRIEVRASFVGSQSVLEVRDDGAGLCAEAPERVGLSNTRARLRHQFGERARLTLSSLHPGCLARIEL